MKLLNAATCMEVNGSKITSMDVGGSFHGSRVTPMEVDGNVYGSRLETR